MIAAVVVLSLTVAGLVSASLALAVRNGGHREQAAIDAAKVTAANDQANQLGETLRLERVARDRQVKALQGELVELQQLIDSYVEPGQVKARLTALLKKAAEK